MTANISNVVKICDALNIKIDELVEGRLVETTSGGKLLDVEEILAQTKHKIKAPGVKIKGQVLDENIKKLLISSVDLIYQLALKMYQK